MSETLIENRKIESTSTALSRPFSHAVRLEKVLLQGFLVAEEPTYLLDPFTGQVLRANAATNTFFRMPGNTIENLFVDKLYPGNRAELHIFLEEALIRGHARTRALALHRPDGGVLSIEHKATAITLGNIDTLIIQLIDLEALHRRDTNEAANSYLKRGLHEWLRDEEYFRGIEREYQLILAAAGEGIYGVGVDGLTTFLNPAAEAILGYKAEELVGQDMHTAIHHHHVDGSDYPSNECPIYNAFKVGIVKVLKMRCSGIRTDTPYRLNTHPHLSLTQARWLGP